MFSQVSVILSTGELCVAGGVCVAGGHVWQGVCMAGGMCGRGACAAGKTATAVDSTHPTGMHSWFLLNSAKSVNRKDTF